MKCCLLSLNLLLKFMNSIQIVTEKLQLLYCSIYSGLSLVCLVKICMQIQQQIVTSQNAKCFNSFSV